MTLLSVPVIDIGPYWTAGEAGKRETAAAVDRACRDIGFLVISGHGVATELVEEAYAVSRKFFDLPLKEKSRVLQPAPHISRGYTPLGSEAVARSRDASATASDINETLIIGSTRRMRLRRRLERTSPPISGRESRRNCAQY